MCCVHGGMVVFVQMRGMKAEKEGVVVGGFPFDLYSCTCAPLLLEIDFGWRSQGTVKDRILEKNVL